MKSQSVSRVDSAQTSYLPAKVKQAKDPDHDRIQMAQAPAQTVHGLQQMKILCDA